MNSVTPSQTVSQDYPLQRPLAYPITKLGADYVRAIIGLFICFAPFAVGMPLTGGTWVLLACGVLFLFYGARTALRQATRIWISDDGVVLDGPFGKAVRWNNLNDVRLSYFSTRRGADAGWMQLRLKGDGATLRLESTLPGFDEVVRRAIRAAGERHIALSAATVKNISAMGLAAADG